MVMMIIISNNSRIPRAAVNEAEAEATTAAHSEDSLAFDAADCRRLCRTARADVSPARLAACCWRRLAAVRFVHLEGQLGQAETPTARNSGHDDHDDEDDADADDGHCDAARQTMRVLAEQSGLVAELRRPGCSDKPKLRAGHVR